MWKNNNLMIDNDTEFEATITDDGAALMESITRIMKYLKDCDRYIFAGLFSMAKREHFRNKKNCFLFHSLLFVFEIVRL